MAMRVFDVETTLTRVVRVTFDDGMLVDGDTAEAAAEEFGERPDAWPEFTEVIEDDLTVESIRVVKP